MMFPATQFHSTPVLEVLVVKPGFSAKLTGRDAQSWAWLPLWQALTTLTMTQLPSLVASHSCPDD